MLLAELKIRLLCLSNCKSVGPLVLESLHSISFPALGVVLRNVHIHTYIDIDILYTSVFLFLTYFLALYLLKYVNSNDLVTSGSDVIANSSACTGYVFCYMLRIRCYQKPG